MAYRTVLLAAFVFLGVVLTIQPCLGVTPYDDVLVQRGIKNLQQENYDEAVADLTQAWEKGTRTAEKAFYLGQAYRHLLNYPKAREFLEEAVRIRPDFPEAQLLLGDTLLAMDKPKEALPYLKQAEARGYEPGKTAFLLGMEASKEGRYQEALDYFQKAQQDPKVAQDAKFQASLALAAQNRLKEAKKSLEESIALSPETPIADFAGRYKGALDRRIYETRPFRASVSASFDYDSNVNVSPGGGAGTNVPSGRGDAVFTQTLGLEYNFHSQGPFSVLTQYGYYQNFHPHVENYDVMSHFFGVVPNYSFKSGRLWVPLSYNYTDVGSDKYYTGFLVNPVYLHMLNDKFGLEFSARYNRKYFWTPVALSEDDRSGKNLGGGFGAYYFYKKQKGYLQARFSYEHDFTTGSNWDSDYYRLFFSWLHPFTDKFKFNIFLDLLLQPYDRNFFNGVTFQGHRNDKILTFGTQATYEIYKGLEVNVHYYFIRDDSNVNLYNYHRHIAGGMLAYRY